MCIFYDDISKILQHLALLLELSGLYLVTVDAWSKNQSQNIVSYFRSLHESHYPNLIDLFFDFNLKKANPVLYSSIIIGLMATYYLSPEISSFSEEMKTPGPGLRWFFYFWFFALASNVGRILVSVIVVTIAKTPQVIGVSVCKLLLMSGNKSIEKGFGIFLASIGLLMEIYQVLTIHIDC